MGFGRVSFSQVGTVIIIQIYYTKLKHKINKTNHIVNTQLSWDPLSSDKLSWDKKTTSFPRSPETPQNPVSKYREEPISALYGPSARHLVSEWYQEENLQSTTGELISCSILYKHFNREQLHRDKT